MTSLCGQNSFNMVMHPINVLINIFSRVQLLILAMSKLSSCLANGVHSSPSKRFFLLSKVLSSLSLFKNDSNYELQDFQ